MEIVAHFRQLAMLIAFKIDLIVWKWESGDIWKLFATEFKIDLIVWK